MLPLQSRPKNLPCFRFKTSAVLVINLTLNLTPILTLTLTLRFWRILKRSNDETSKTPINILLRFLSDAFNF
jgi:hypothetical protein